MSTSVSLPETDQGKTKIHETFVGKVVLSINSGIGKITSITEMGGDDYFVIQYEGSTVVDYSRINGHYTFRLLSSGEDFDAALAEFKKNKKPVSFESKKDRVHYFKDLQDQHELSSIVKLVQETSAFEDLGTVEKKIRDRCLDSIIQEYGIQKSLEAEASRKEVELLVNN